MTDKITLQFMKCILQPLFDTANSKILTPTEQYIKLKEYIKKLDLILSEGEQNV